MSDADARIAELEAKVTLLEEQMSDLATITGTIIEQVFGEFPTTGLKLVWKTFKDDGDDVGIWELEKYPALAAAGGDDVA